MILYYVIFFFLIIRFAITLFNFISNPKLTTSVTQFSDPVSILIPARNEEKNIVRLLQSIQEQDYQNYEVIVLDDDSEDRTFEACSVFAEKDKRFQVLKGEPLRAGWLGKNFACHQLAKQAKGKYLLFLDADEKVKEGLINNSINRMKISHLALLSLFTNQIMITTGEYAVVPLMHFLLLNLLPLRLVRLSKSASFSAASGQFMLFEASIYRNEQWHKRVKDKVVEDIEIMKILKQRGYVAETLLANGYVKCRMYTGYRDAVSGFSKNLLAGFNNNIAALICYLLLVILGPVFIALYLNWSLLFFYITLIVLTRLMISLMSGQRAAFNILLHPVQMISLLVIAAVSVQKYLTKSITWKGRTIINEN